MTDFKIGDRVLSDMYDKNQNFIIISQEEIFGKILFRLKNPNTGITFKAFDRDIKLDIKYYRNLKLNELLDE